MMNKVLTYSTFFVLLFTLYGCPLEERGHVDLDKITTTQHDSNGNLIMEGERSKTTGKGVYKYYQTDGVLNYIHEFNLQTGKGIFRFYYPDGTLKKVQEVIQDSIEHGTYKFYYPSGVLKDSAQITHGKFHGNRYRYYENGVLKNNSLYYTNGNLRNEIEHDSTGLLKEYLAFNYRDYIAFVVRYDNKGHYKKLEENEEHLSYLIYSFVLEESYPLDEQFSIELLVGQPPKFKTSVWVGYRYKNEAEITELVSGEPDHFNRVNYTLTQNPDKDIEIINVAKAVSKEAVISDTVIIEVSKKGKTSYQHSK